MSRCRPILSSSVGATAVEYVLALTLVALVAMLGFVGLGAGVSAKVQCAARAIAGARGGCANGSAFAGSTAGAAGDAHATQSANGATVAGRVAALGGARSALGEDDDYDDYYGYDYGDDDGYYDDDDDGYYDGDDWSAADEWLPHTWWYPDAWTVAPAMWGHRHVAGPLILARLGFLPTPVRQLVRAGAWVPATMSMFGFVLATAVSAVADEILVKPSKWTWNHTAGPRSWIAKRFVDAVVPNDRVGRVHGRVWDVIGSFADHLAGKWRQGSWTAPLWTLLDSAMIGLWVAAEPVLVAIAYVEDRALGLIDHAIVRPGRWMGHEIGATASSAWGGAKSLAHDLGSFLGL